MRVLVWAATLGAIVGSANGSSAIACPTHQGTELFPSRILELSSSVSAARTAIQSAFDSWIAEAFFSDSDHETISTMAGFHDPLMQSAGLMPEDVSSTASIGAPAVDFDLDDWSALDVVSSPAGLKGLDQHGAGVAHGAWQDWSRDMWYAH